MMKKKEKQKILEELGGIPEDLYDRLVCNLIAQIHEQITKLKAALDRDDYNSIAQSAHFIKGASVNLRIHKIYEIAKSMESVSTSPLLSGERNKVRGYPAKDEIAGSLKKLESALAELEK